jgi:hypothetical protein
MGPPNLPVYQVYVWGKLNLDTCSSSRAIAFLACLRRDAPNAHVEVRRDGVRLGWAEIEKLLLDECKAQIAMSRYKATRKVE